MHINSYESLFTDKGVIDDWSHTGPANADGGRWHDVTSYGDRSDHSEATYLIGCNGDACSREANESDAANHHGPTPESTELPAVRRGVEASPVASEVSSASEKP
jgi:hypothetical protein